LNYHTLFPDIHPKTLEIIRSAKERGIWRLPKEQGFDVIRQMYNELSTQVYHVPVPSLVEARYEHYLVIPERIGLPRVSLVSALHEYRHHLQKYGRQRYPEKEIDARGWSISAFYLALPNDFDKAWREGKIWFMPPYPGR
jgi:hypothetical protein